jgi:hypothetical protein
MKKYEIKLPIRGHVIVEVTAPDPRAAKVEALEQARGFVGGVDDTNNVVADFTMRAPNSRDIEIRQVARFESEPAPPKCKGRLGYQTVGHHRRLVCERCGAVAQRRADEGGECGRPIIPR